MSDAGRTEINLGEVSSYKNRGTQGREELAGVENSHGVYPQSARSLQGRVPKPDPENENETKGGDLFARFLLINNLSDENVSHLPFQGFRHGESTATGGNLMLASRWR